MLSPEFTVTASAQKSTEPTARVTFANGIPGVGTYESAFEPGSEDDSEGASPPRRQLFSKEALSNSGGFRG